MSNFRTYCILSLVIAFVLGYPQPNALTSWDRTCCQYTTCGGGDDQFWYLYVPSDVQFSCEDIIQNSNRFHFYDETLNSPGSTVHPDFSGYAWEINGCHFDAPFGGCTNSASLGLEWCSYDDDFLDGCDDDNDGGGRNTWTTIWSDATDTYDDECPYQFTIVRTWSSLTTCFGLNPDAPIRSQQIIYVVDQTVPNLQIPADMAIECPTNFVPDYVLGQATAVDQCTTTSVRYTNNLAPVSGTCNAGTMTRTFTAADRCGNEVTQTQTVQIVDTTPPIIPQLAAVTTTCDATGTATTGTPGTIGFYSCERFIKSGPTWFEIPEGTCFTDTTLNNFGCGRVPAGIARTFNLNVAVGDFITLEFNDIRLEGRGTIRIYDGPSAAFPLLFTITSPAPPATPPTPLPSFNPGPITGSTNDITVTYTPDTVGDPVPIDGFTGFWYAHKVVPDRTVAASTLPDVIIPGHCEGTYTILRTWQAADECNNIGTMTQTIFVVDNTPPSTNPIFPPQTNIVEAIDCLADFISFDYTPVDTCSQTGATITKQVGLVGASGQNYAFGIAQTFTATDGCDNTITWSYTQEIGYYPIYISTVLPPYIQGASKGSPFGITIGVAEFGNIVDVTTPTFCTSPVVVVVDAGPALLSIGSDPCWTQAAGGLLYCDTTTVNTVFSTDVALELTVPLDYTPNSLIISITIAERSLVDVSIIPILGLIFGAPATSDNVVVTFA